MMTTECEVANPVAGVVLERVKPRPHFTCAVAISFVVQTTLIVVDVAVVVAVKMRGEVVSTDHVHVFAFGSIVPSGSFA